VTDPVLESPRTIEIDSRGIFYVSTWNGEIVKSSDHGLSWQKCTKPYSENPYYIFMDVANDDNIWVFKFESPNIFSADGGVI
jgi:streptogramin lyase